MNVFSLSVGSRKSILSIESKIKVIQSKMRYIRDKEPLGFEILRYYQLLRARVSTEPMTVISIKMLILIAKSKIALISFLSLSAKHVRPKGVPKRHLPTAAMR